MKTIQVTIKVEVKDEDYSKLLESTLEEFAEEDNLLEFAKEGVQSVAIEVTTVGNHLSYYKTIK